MLGVGVEEEYDGIDHHSRLFVRVTNLSYHVNPHASPLLQQLADYSTTYLPKELRGPLVRYREERHSSALCAVSFVAEPSQLTAILCSEKLQRRSIIELIAGTKQYGEFDGNVQLVNYGGNIVCNPDSIAFVPRSAIKLYTPGLTYYETLIYAAKLRTNLHGQKLQARVHQVLKIMKLTWCKDRLINERPTTRGTLGGELRKLIIAMEIINLPQVILLDDITKDLDSTVTASIIECLVTLSEKGHTVVCSLPKPSSQVFNQLGTIVLISNGRTIYSSTRENIVKYFCGDPLTYRVTQESNLVDFLYDIADGVERPKGHRKPLSSEVLQTMFDASPYHQAMHDLKGTGTLLPETTVPYYGYFAFTQPFSILENIRKSLTVVMRALYVKSREYEVLRKGLMSSVIIGLFMGYFMYNQGNFGDYTMNVVRMPYAEVSNCAAAFFIFLAVLFLQQVINVHILCQKIEVFRFERSNNACPTMGFFVGAVISEIPFTVFFGLIFANITYFLGSFQSGWENYIYYMSVQALVSIVGFLTTLMFAALFRNEIFVRDFFLFCSFMMFMTSGFIFQRPTMTDFINDLSVINVLRWAYEAIMVWNFQNYGDGEEFLEKYEFQNFEKKTIFPILINFIIFDLAIFFLAIIPSPNLLRRRNPVNAGKDIDSRDSVDPLGKSSASTRSDGLVAPNIFLRESSITSKTPLASQNSISEGHDGDKYIRGPMITFKRLNYRVADRKSPLGYRTVLHTMTGRFDWGRLGAIIGGTESGKSSLLSILAGQSIAKTAKINGQVFYDNNPINLDLLPWQRCAYIESLDEQYRDLTVLEILTFAMELRCIDRQALESVQLNVMRTIELLKLTEVVNVMSKSLDPGSLRRLSIAEEMVHGPSLVFVDEPISGMSAKDASVIMTGAFREFVNQDRTVVVTMHQPSEQVFELVDTLCLLSKGRMLYMGPANKAAAFFIESPTLMLHFQEYKNPADFLCDLSAGLIENKNGEKVDATVLESHFNCSELAAIYYMGYMDANDSSSSTSASASASLSKKSTMKNPLIIRSDSEDEKYNDIEGVSSPYGNNMNSDPRSNSFEVDYIYNVENFCCDCFANLILAISEAYTSMKKINYYMQVYKLKVLLVRAWFKLFRRTKMVLSTSAVILYLALVFGWIIGKSTDEPNTVTGLFGISTMCTFLAMMQFVFWLFTNNQIFLREHSRGLYSILLHWIIDDIPLLALRTVQSFVYAIIIHEIVKLRAGSAQGYFYMCNWISFLVGTVFTESLVYTLPSVRSAYTVIPAMAFVTFYFSGIMVKPSTLPGWLSPWLPSVSFIRWLTQGMIINEYEHNEEAFPYFPAIDYSTYEGFLNLFGWGGKSKFYCFRVLILNIFIYKVFNLLVAILTAATQKGKRILRKSPTDFIRLY